MRGKAGWILDQVIGCGITPAYAGKRTAETKESTRFKDHPRLCGEKVFSSTLNNQNTGSPPPMRGKVVTGQNHGIKVGITPAYAGKRQLSTLCSPCP